MLKRQFEYCQPMQISGFQPFASTITMLLITSHIDILAKYLCFVKHPWTLQTASFIFNNILALLLKKLTTSFSCNQSPHPASLKARDTGFRVIVAQAYSPTKLPQLNII